MRLVGILGGMGPEATILLMQRVLAAVPARDDADHVPLLVFQYPQVPSRIAALIEGTGADPGPVLAGLAARLESAGAEAVAMPCNTAHVYAPQIRAATRLPFLDMVEATAEAIVGPRPHGARVGMLASPAVRIAGVFDAAFAGRGLVPVWRRDGEALLGLIRAVKAGRGGTVEKAELGRLAAALVERQGADVLAVACTELSLLAPDLSADLPGGPPVLDTLDCLADRIVAFSLN